MEKGKRSAMPISSRQGSETRPSLLLVDDDVPLCEVLEGQLSARGFEVRVANGAKQALRLVQNDAPRYAVIALRLPDGSGLKLLSALIALDPHMRVVVLTGYPSIRTAIEAIKLGAADYLTKPASADDVISALQRDRGNDNVPISRKSMSVHQAEREYISQVLRAHSGNISASARALSMDRRTLQRKLRKRLPSD
jgi:two-component system response regulator RegA